MNWRNWVLAGTYGSLAGALRVPFGFIPSVQPSTALVVLAGQAWGPAMGGMVGVLVAVVSNMFLGQGPWTPFQALAWGLVGVASGLLPVLRNRWALATWGAFASFSVWALVLDSWQWWTFARPHSWSTLVPVLLAGVPFNVAHAVSTGAVLFAVGPRIHNLLSRGRVRILGTTPRGAPGPVPAGLNGAAAPGPAVRSEPAPASRN